MVSDTTGMARLDRVAAPALAGLFALLAVYGLWSAPGLAARWGASLPGLGLLLAWAGIAGWVVASAIRDSGRWGWAGFAGAALAMRLACLAMVTGRDALNDPHWYPILARHLLSGQGLFVDDPMMGVRVFAVYPPAYPVLLAGWGAIAGLSGLSVLALSTLLDLGTAALVARLGTRLGEGRAGRAAAALYLIWPSVLFNAPLAQKESLEILLVLALAHGWLGAGERPLLRSAAMIGLPAALLALTQPGMAALAGLFGIALLPRIGWRRLVTVGTAGAAVTIAAMLPWWIRNWQVFHAFVPLTSVGGLSLWVGENPDATGNWMPYPPAIRGLPEIQLARAAGRMAVDWMTHHPIDVLRLNAAKFVRAMGVGQYAVTRLDAMRPAQAPGLLAALLPLTHGAQVLLMGAAAASLAAARRREPLLTALIVAIMAQLLVFGLWFEFSERHRELLTPFLLLGIAIAATRIRPRTAPSAWAAGPPAA